MIDRCRCIIDSTVSQVFSGRINDMCWFPEEVIIRYLKAFFSFSFIVCCNFRRNSDFSMKEKERFKIERLRSTPDWKKRRKGYFYIMKCVSISVIGKMNKGN